ncbi:hypothetical protein [Streptosporangium roseum]|uniref:hypothetical protein n=1 Tax=Streptosporangium roseum TaxID=2001 RepID=UPI00331773B4
MATTLRSLLLTATGSVAVLGAVLAMRATAATGEFVLVRGVELEIRGIPALGQEAFTGSWGRASMGSSGGEDGGDWDDPDGVRAFVSLAGRQLRARVAAPVSWEAGGRFRVRHLRLNPRAGLPLLVTGTVRTGVSWRPSGPAGSSVVAAPGSVAVLGQPVEAGTTSIPATGVQLGYPGVTTAVLTVVRTDVRKTSPYTGGGPRAAEAGMTLAISGRMVGASGDVVYDGPLAEVTLGGASVDCAGDAARREPGLTPPPAPAPSGAPASAPPATGGGPDGTPTFADSLLSMLAASAGCSRPSA